MDTADRGDPREPGGARAADHAEQHRLGLIARRVAAEDRAEPEPRRRLLERRVARASRLVLQARALRHLHAQDLRARAELVRELRDRGGRPRATAPEPVIDVAERNFEAGLGRGEPQQTDQGGRVGAARAGDEEAPRAGGTEGAEGLADVAEGAGDGRVAGWHARAAMIPCRR